MGITADDYKRVVNRNLNLEERLAANESLLRYQQEITAGLIKKLEELKEDHEIRTAQYKKLLDFYHYVRELTAGNQTAEDTWKLLYKSGNYDGSFVWGEDEEGLPLVP